MPITVPTRPGAENQLVDAAERSIRVFGGPDIDRDQAAELLASWSHHGSLTAHDRAEILHRFPVGDTALLSAHIGYAVGGRS